MAAVLLLAPFVTDVIMPSPGCCYYLLTCVMSQRCHNSINRVRYSAWLLTTPVGIYDSYILQTRQWWVMSPPVWTSPIKVTKKKIALVCRLSTSAHSNQRWIVPETFPCVLFHNNISCYRLERGRQRLCKWFHPTSGNDSILIHEISFLCVGLLWQHVCILPWQHRIMQTIQKIASAATVCSRAFTNPGEQNTLNVLKQEPARSPFTGLWI